MNILNTREYYNRKPVEYIINQKNIVNESFIHESSSFVPRFSLKEIEIFKDIPTNKPLKPNKNLIIKAIKYGMIFLINYKGAEDKHFSGHERVIYPMVLGRSSKGKILLRGYHLNGWSVSNNKHVNKVWRMFRLDRILSLTFTGSFYRLAPDGYKMDDKGMRGGIIAKADFNHIRRNQQNLLNKKKIQSKEEVSLERDDRKFVTVRVHQTNTIMDIENALENPIINKSKDIDNLRVSFLKSIYGNRYISILGAIGKPGNIVKMIDNDTNKTLGTFKVLDSVDGKALKNIKRVKGNKKYELFIFERKL